MSRVKNFLLLLLSFVLLTTLASARTQTRQRQAGAQTVYAERFPGSDLGAKINAADRSLGGAAGEIVARGGGRITTPIIISQNHTLRLLAGIYAPFTAEIPILLKEGASVVGAGWDQTIILESPAKNQFTVIAAHNNTKHNGVSDRDITITGVQIRGANPEFNSAQQAISLGNCSRCTVDRVWINGTRSIGIQLGGTGREGNFAQDSKVTNCLFTHVASQNLALNNGRNILFENNRFLAQGQANGPGSTTIDLEPNEAEDRIQNVTIRNNYIDARATELPTAGNGIVVQATTGTTLVGPILIEGNTIIGGSIVDPVTNKISNGIYVYGPTMRDVTIRNNSVTRTGQSGISLEGSHLTVVNNRFKEVGGGGLPGAQFVRVTDSTFTGNSLTCSGNQPCDGRILAIQGTRNNVIRNNSGFAAPSDK
jgi:hypothetical protein